MTLRATDASPSSHVVRSAEPAARGDARQLALEIVRGVQQSGHIPALSTSLTPEMLGEVAKHVLALVQGPSSASSPVQHIGAEREAKLLEVLGNWFPVLLEPTSQAPELTSAKSALRDAVQLTEPNSVVNRTLQRGLASAGMAENNHQLRLALLDTADLVRELLSSTSSERQLAGQLANHYARGPIMDALARVGSGSAFEEAQARAVVLVGTYTMIDLVDSTHAEYARLLRSGASEGVGAGNEAERHATRRTLLLAQALLATAVGGREETRSEKIERIFDTLLQPLQDTLRRGDPATRARDVDDARYFLATVAELLPDGHAGYAVLARAPALARAHGAQAHLACADTIGALRKTLAA